MNHKIVVCAAFLCAALNPCGAELPTEEGLPIVEASDAVALSGQILLYIGQGQLGRAVALYRELRETRGEDDLELVQRMGGAILQQGLKSQDPEEMLLSLFGAGVTGDTRYLPLFEAAISSSQPHLQMAAIHFLSNFHDDKADQLLKKALSSAFLPARFEAAYSLAKKKKGDAFGQIEALMYKVDPRMKVLFPALYVLEGSLASSHVLKQLLTDQQVAVRLEALIQVADADRDDFLSQIRQLATHTDPAQQEACAYALGRLKDTQSLPKLQALAGSPHLTVKLAACFALYSLGKKEAAEAIAAVAQTEQNPFAIRLLAELEGYEELLVELMRTSQSLTVRANATLALLHKRDARCVDGLYELLLSHPKDIALVEQSSQGLALSAWKAIPSASHQLAKIPYAQEMVTAIKEQIVQLTVDLPAPQFLQVAYRVIATNQRHLVPAVVALLQNMQSKEAIELLVKEADRAGAPLVRGYCNLALYRLHIPGPYRDRVLETVALMKNAEIIRFRTPLPWKVRKVLPSAYQLTPEESSRLLIESLIALAQEKDPVAADALLTAIVEGNPKNRFALAGLLMRMAE